MSLSLAVRPPSFATTADLLTVAPIYKGFFALVDEDLYQLISDVATPAVNNTTLDDWKKIGSDIDLGPIEAEIAEKADQDDLDNVVIDVSNLTDEVATKADLIDLAEKVDRDEILVRYYQRADYFNKMVPVANRPGHGLPSSSGTTFTWGESRIKYIATCDITNIALAFANYFDGDSITGLGNITVRAGIEYNGSRYAVWFNGSRTVIIEPGAGGVCSKPVGVSIPAGGTYYVVTQVVVTSGQQWPFLLTTRTIDTESAEFGTGTALDKTLTGTFPTGLSINTGATTSGSATVTSSAAFFAATDVGRAISGTGIPAGATITAFGSTTSITISANATATASGVTLTLERPGTAVFAAQNVLCNIPSLGGKAVDLPVIGAIGDSIVYGLRETTPETDLGFINRALDSLSPPAARVKFDRSGSTAQGFALPSSGSGGRDGSQRRRPMLDACSSAIEEFGVNDLNGGRTLLELQTDVITIWLWCKQRNIRTFRTTLSPWTTSTDAWVTLVNQTATIWESTRVAFNEWLRDGAPMTTSFVPLATGVTAGAGVLRVPVNSGGNAAILPRKGTTNHPLYGVIELADSVESARNSGKWKVSASTGVIDITLNSRAANVVSGSFVDGQLLVATGSLTTNTVIASGAGTSTIQLSLLALVTTAGLNVVTAYTSDGIHPSPEMWANMANTVPLSELI